MLPRPEVSKVAPAFHGGAPPRRDGVLDFSVCSNPLGAAPAVRAAAQAAAIERYPEPEAASLRRALAERLGLPRDRVVVGNGSVELFWLAAACYVERGDRVLVVGPTFAEYARPSRLMGAEVVEYRACAGSDFRPNLAQLVAEVATVRPKLVFLCNPNNPTGVYLGHLEVAALLDAAPGLLVLDEAYVGLSAGPWDVRPLLADDRLVVVRSLTKEHALAGLRLGYAVAAAAVARALQWAQPPWSVNAAAQAAGLAALAADDHVARGRALADEAKAYLAGELEAMGFRVVPSAANFVLAQVGDAASLTASLLHAGFYVRDCTSFGLPEYVRIAARPLQECEALVAALARVVTLNSRQNGRPPIGATVG